MGIKALIVLIVGTGLLGLGAWFVSLYTAKPEPVDYNEAYRAVESAYNDGVHDPLAWSEFVAVATGIGPAIDAEADRLLVELDGTGSILLDMARVFNDDGEALQEREIAGSRRLLNWYIASDWPERLGDALEREGVLPESLADQGPLTIMSITQPLGELRAAARAEAYRMRDGIVRDDVEMTVDAARNISRIIRIADAQPLVISSLVRVAIEALATDQVLNTLANGTMDAEEARALLPIIEAWAESEPQRSANHFVAEGIVTRSTLRALYEGTDPSIRLSKGPPRFLWSNHKTIDDLTVAYFDELARHVEEGPSIPAPAYPWNETSVVSRIRRAPLTLLLPAINAAARAHFQSRSKLRACVLHMALHIHTDDTGALPAALDELVDAGILGSLPDDPFKPSHPFGYAPDAEPPSGYRLWSVGPDLTDNGGTGPVWPSNSQDVAEGEDAMYPRER